VRLCVRVCVCVCVCVCVFFLGVINCFPYDLFADIGRVEEVRTNIPITKQRRRNLYKVVDVTANK
jgi:hypothetical protein